jgi:hypothetical protein
MTRREYYILETFGCIEAILECEALNTKELAVSAVYDAHDDLCQRDLMSSTDLVIQRIAEAVSIAAKRDAGFVASVWQRQEEERQEAHPQMSDREYHSLSARQLGVGAWL